MLVDFRQLDDGAALETDICIIGAGAAGISMALTLAESRRRVLLLEGGGLEFEPDTQALYEGEVVGAPYASLDLPRLRFFGGTTNHWDGHCRPLDPIDFEVRPWVPFSGWPIDRTTLDPFYETAQKVCELGPMQYDTAKWEGLSGKIVPFDAARVKNRMWQYSPPTRFGERYRDDLEQSKNVTVLLHGNAIELLTPRSAGRVDGVRIKSLQGKERTVRANVFVVACGGIENPRLLLSSNKVHSAGMGNEHGLVGRFFLEHPHAIVAYAIPTSKQENYEAYYSSVEIAGVPIQVKPGISEDVQKRLKILNGCIDIGYGYDRSPGYLGLFNIVRNLKRGRVPDAFGESLVRVISDLGGAGTGLYRHATGENVMWFGSNFEQAPNPDSRVTLSTERDALGSPRAKLDWRLSPIDKHSVRVACKIVGEELARLGLARMRMDEWFLADDTTWVDLAGHFHHMGTTRMSDDPSRGVVDKNCRVHGMSNLYIAGSSVFATAGYANATLTIVALALRLADHLRHRS